jgi:translocation and assembly module TamB
MAGRGRAASPATAAAARPAPQDGGQLGAPAAASSWGAAGLGMDLRAQAQALQLLVRADRQLSLSGDVQATLQGGQFGCAAS